jgi:hypothetical protein
LRAIPVPAERGQADGMSRVIGEIESAFDVEGLITGIGQARFGRLHKAVEFVFVRRFFPELANTDQIIQMRAIHGDLP